MNVSHPQRSVTFSTPSVAAEAPASPESRPRKLLFIGNILTAANDLPRMFRQFVVRSQAGEHLTTQAITPDGVALMDHWNTTSTRKAILEGRVYVIAIK